MTGLQRIICGGKGIIPILKVDKGLAEEEDGVRLMKPIPGLEDPLDQGKGTPYIRNQDAFRD